MKKLEIIIRAENLEKLKEVLDVNGAKGLNITNIMGYGNQKGYTKIYRGSEYQVNLLPKIKVETVVSDDMADKIIDQVVKEIHSGEVGDGKIFVSTIDEAVRIRTNERGEDAL